MVPLFVTASIVVFVLVVWFGSRRRATPAARGSAITAPGRWGEPRSPFRIATYNIHGGKGDDRRTDLRRTAAALSAVAPDIAGLQEVRGALLRRSAGQAETIARELETGHLFLPGQMRWGREAYGNALLSRFPVTAWTREPLVDSTQRKHRTITTATVPVGGHEVAVLVTHLSTRTDRDAQLRAVLERLEAFEVAVLAGDLNRVRDDADLRGFVDAGRAVDAIGTALGSDDPPDRIDWILTRGLEVRGGGRTPRGVSDHPLFWVDLALPERTDT